MNIKDKVKAVEEIFNELDKDILIFQQKSGLKCKEGCIECCLKTDIEASLLEFLPLAWWLVGTNSFEYWLKKAESSGSSHCIFLDKQKRCCKIYEKRGLICRLFGFSFKLDKNRRPHLIACPYLKRRFHFLPTLSTLPISSHYSMKLIAIDPYLANQRYQINIAIYKALQLVATYMHFKKAA